MKNFTDELVLVHSSAIEYIRKITGEQPNGRYHLIDPSTYKNPMNERSLRIEEVDSQVFYLPKFEAYSSIDFMPIYYVVSTSLVNDNLQLFGFNINNGETLLNSLDSGLLYLGNTHCICEVATLISKLESKKTKE
jgi:hypothetical protein